MPQWPGVDGTMTVHGQCMVSNTSAWNILWSNAAVDFPHVHFDDGHHTGKSQFVMFVEPPIKIMICFKKISCMGNLHMDMQCQSEILVPCMELFLHRFESSS